jgi:NAD(P)-dependent dehydrogenase (short-subunit alcohol dehydrogenase family)
MGVKAEVSNNYLEKQKEIHGHKAWQPPIWAIMSGDRREGSIGEAIHRDIVAGGGKVHSLLGDIRDPDTFFPLATKGVNTLIMCHGVSHLDWFEDIPEGRIKEIVDVNVTGTLTLTQRFVKATLDKPWRKRIIMIGSMAHKAVLNGSVAYCASKAAVAHMARCLAWELAPKGFDVFVIHPSNTRGTPMSLETIEGLERYRGLSREDAEAYWNDTMIRSTSLTKDHIVETIRYLLSEKAEYLAGAQIDLAGGQR